MNPTPASSPVPSRARTLMDRAGGFLLGSNRQAHAEAHPPQGLFERFRELFDELVFVFAIVMFMKMFLVELYKIPTGSMTPTLLGGTVAVDDVNNDSLKDIVHWDQPAHGREGLVFLNEGNGHYRPAPHFELSQATIDGWLARKILRYRSDYILVNKFAYWTQPPHRGDVVIFKVPHNNFRPEAPIYVKRLVGEPGETVAFDIAPDAREEPWGSSDMLGRLKVNGRLVDSPRFFKDWRYRASVSPSVDGLYNLPYFSYRALPDGRLAITEMRVPEGEALVLGDNTEGSLDSRYWGTVPLNHFLGRAFVRVFPFGRFGRIQ